MSGGWCTPMATNICCVLITFLPSSYFAKVYHSHYHLKNTSIVLCSTKALDTFGIVKDQYSYLMYPNLCITILEKFGLSRERIMKEKNTLVAQMCVLIQMPKKRL